MIFEIKPYQSDSVMLTATSIDDIPVDDLDEMYFEGMQLFLDGKRVTSEQVKMRIKIIKEDEAWAAEEAIPVKAEESEQKPLDSLDLEKIIMADEAAAEADQAENTQEDIESEPEEVVESEAEEAENQVQAEIGEATKQTDETELEDADSESISDEEVIKSEKPGIYVDDGISEPQYFATMAAASRSLDIPSYKISDAIKQGKELNGLKFRKVE